MKIYTLTYKIYLEEIVHTIMIFVWTDRPIHTARSTAWSIELDDLSFTWNIYLNIIIFKHNKILVSF
jgi:hypothetical protein